MAGDIGGGGRSAINNLINVITELNQLKWKENLITQVQKPKTKSLPLGSTTSSLLLNFKKRRKEKKKS
jgi:hypothetical protein